MVSLLLRLAFIGSTLVVAWNVIVMWVRVLRGPRKPATLPPAYPPSPARDMAQDALRAINAIQLEVASLKDAEMWQATNKFGNAVERLNMAVLNDPDRYRLAKRYLGQILPAAEEALGKFAALYKTGRKEAAKVPFLELTGELTTAFNQAADDYMKAIEAEVLVEADVLRDLLDRARRD